MGGISDDYVLENGILTCTASVTNGGPVQFMTTPIGDKCYAVSRFKTDSASVRLYCVGVTTGTDAHPGDNEFHVISTIIVSPDSDNNRTGLRDTRLVGSGTPFSVDYVLMMNLSQIFGRGNEPTKEQMDELIKNCWYLEWNTNLNTDATACMGT